jgi:hypothetical protein
MAANALHFTAASSQYGTIADAGTIFGGFTAISVCFWAKLDSIGTWREAFAKDDYSTRTFICSMYGTAFRMYVFQDGNHGNSGNANTGLGTGVWNWLYFDWDKVSQQTPRMFLNNVQDNSGGAVQANTLNSNGLNLAIGANSGGVNPFDGAIDSVGVFNRQLGSDEMGSIYAAGVGAQIPSAWSGLLGAWELDEGSGTTFADTLGNSNGIFTASQPTWVTGHVPAPAAGGARKQNLGLLGVG